MALNRVTKIDDSVSVKHVLVSVSDKTNLESFILGVKKACPEVIFYSTGGTFQEIERILGQGSTQLVSISDYTGQPEMQGGLVKTLDFKIYLGLLSETYNDHHRQDLARTGAVNFDLVVVNLYPFEKTVAAPGVTPEDARANIDIGGPTMIRAAAKNYLRCAPVVDPQYYSQVVQDLSRQNGRLTLAQRFDLAKQAFRRIRDYDMAIADYLEKVDSKGFPGLYSLVN